MNPSLNRDQTGVVVVDVQGDFTCLKQGSLAVKETDQAYLDKVVAATGQLKARGYKIFATQDCHPENHVSFYTSHPGKSAYDRIEINGKTHVLWPPHCVRGTENADILLDADLFFAVIQKGTHPEYDSYSGFFDDNGTGTGLLEMLTQQGITTLILYGLATDYCVRATAMDARASGFDVVLVKALCKGVASETTTAALKEMKAAGIQLVSTISDIGQPL